MSPNETRHTQWSWRNIMKPTTRWANDLYRSRKRQTKTTLTERRPTKTIFDGTIWFHTSNPSARAENAGQPTIYIDRVTETEQRLACWSLSPPRKDGKSEWDVENCRNWGSDSKSRHGGMIGSINIHEIAKRDQHGFPNLGNALR